MFQGRTSLKQHLVLVAGILLLVGLAQFMGQYTTELAREKADSWAQKGGKGLLVRLYDNPFLTGPAKVSTRPSCRYLILSQEDKPAQPLHASWRWLANLKAPKSGEYLIDIFAAEAIRLFIDGKPVIDHWAARAPRHLRTLVWLEKGGHLWDLRNVQSPHHLVLSQSWAPPGAPASRLIPDSAFTPLDNQKATTQALYEINQAQRRWLALAWLLPLGWILLWFVFLKNPGAIYQSLKKHWAVSLILLLAGFLRLVWGDIVPGVSGESAYFLYRAELISQGALPFQGMIARTGPFLDYLLALPVMAFGPSPWLLRITSGLLNTLAILFCYRVFLRETNKTSALTACLLLAVLPGVVIFSRNPVDYTSLGPLLFFVGLDLFSLSRKKPPLCILGGVLWGIGVFNHSIFVVFPATLGLAGLLVSRFKVLKHPLYWGGGLGMLIGILPRLIERMVNNHRTPMSFFDLGRLKELGGFTDILLRTIDGQIIYQLYTGEYAWAVFGIIPLALLAAYLVLGWGYFKKRDNESWIDAVLCLAIIIFILMAPIGAPTANPRYFAYCVILAGLVMARGWSRSLCWTQGNSQKAVKSGLALFTVFCLASLGVNYFYTHLKSGGHTLPWKNRLLDHVSDAWMNHGLMADFLEKKGYPVVATADRWHHTLNLALNLYQKKPLKFMATPIESRSATERAAVFYNSPEGIATMKRYLRGNPKKTFKRVKLPDYLASKYILLERKAPPVPYSRAMEEIR
ncbi:glycosyltransferase family 39 protein [Dethiosulfatarculus sandiegensis]|uniref:PA14 domain-containing protein n=1 Tax=Dethiosulfatarculus sandiegensis TaxID=1429043 RepID=A0A0D2J5P8_9BACT|nr:glycosyltransferase family 39 protein [Dethiosulfatarculus sandiegensis]KIX11001.1 hypothetical protein X474_26985 [Dethiosulfatarculus sandiegensis]